MTIETWGRTPEAYLAVVVWLSFIWSLFYSISCLYMAVQAYTEWIRGNCVAELKYWGVACNITALWSVFVLLRYFMGVLAR